MSAFLSGFGGVALVSMVSLVGVLTLSWNVETVRRVTRHAIAFAVGALVGDAFIHLLPHTLRDPGPAWVPVFFSLAGFVGFFAVEKFIRSRLGGEHGDAPEAPDHSHAVRPVVGVNLMGDALHNFIDGMLIGASFLVSVPLGISTTTAVLLHEIPQEIGDFGILVHGGLPVRRAIRFNLLSASAAFLGLTASWALGAAVEGVDTALLAMTAGGFLYIAGADLIPDLHHQRTTVKNFAVQTGLIALGICLMALLTLLD